jgi:hypothetical protein
MEIGIDYNRNCKFYIYIYYNDEKIANDKNIIRLLNIEYIEYINILKSHNAILHSDDEYYFEEEEECKKIVKYIKEKYNDRLVYLALIENSSEANKLVGYIYRI